MLPASPLKLRRVEIGFSQLDLSRAAGISREQISKIESGKADPRLSTLEALARALECPLANLAPLNDKREAINLPLSKIGQDGPTDGT